ncbi:spermidine/putrescine ABC transporter, permease component [Campylobacter iguaniorum]|uniref:Spermidine/putrescine ABC transporter, permease component n=1 Tax=Campylobacter iguaniorum TaxID=1244531 RepID=A0A076FGQ1_9BACT|nr:ABC transporter permease [Campylobacter iguaniorum]AII14984.1 spermidine/putrescine ABC transporter, permease component [Campylobacter iguaniorum]ALV24812.1 spermidine/putrescine ABC transporter, permease component [Campylobacter iguaniorum]
MNKISQIYHYSVVSVLFCIIVLPMVATLIYSFSSSWSSNILPDGFSLAHYKELLGDVRFFEALFNSLLVCFASIFLAIIVIFPVVFCANFYFLNLKNLMSFISILPFAIAPIVLSVGLLNLYSDTISGTPYILIGCYVCIATPFIYRSIDNNIAALNLKEIVYSNYILGNGIFRAIFRVIIPNLKDALLISIFLSFSFLIGEFLYANILVGTQFETLQVYLYNIKNKSGHVSSAAIVSYLLLIFIANFISSYISHRKKG